MLWARAEAAWTAQGEDGAGCLLERTYGGASPIELEPGLQRAWVEDMDTITLTAWCEKDGERIGFGECRSTILPAITNPAGHPK